MPRSPVLASAALAALAAAWAPAPTLAQRSKPPAPAPYYPSLHEWEKKAPEAVGMDPALVKDAVAKADVDAMKKKLEEAGAKVVVK